MEDGGSRFGHGGWNLGFTSSLIAFSDSGSGVALMANSDNGPLLFERLAASIAAEYGWTSFRHRLESPFMTADLLLRLRGVDALIAWVAQLLADGSAPWLSSNLLNQMGYGLIMEEDLAGAVKVLEANVGFYPEDANAHDSLGEAYVMAGRIPEAIASYRRSLELDPTNENARRMLEKLGAALTVP